MSGRVTDKYGRCTIKLNEVHNTPGELSVDGDLYDSGPVAFLSFKVSSDRIGVDGEVDFGGFALTMPSGFGAHVEGNIVLDEPEARRLIAALLEQFESPTTETD